MVIIFNINNATEEATEELADLAKFELGVSDKDMSETYTNIGFILSVIIEAKMNENFYEFLHELKPIAYIDQYMKRFANELDLALRHNEHLSLIVMFLIQDAGQLKTESEVALNSVLKVEEFVKFLSKQEKSHNESIGKTIEVMANIANKQEEIKGDHGDVELMAIRHNPTTPNLDQQKAPISGAAETTIKLSVNDRSETLSISKALEVIKKSREEYEKHCKARISLRLCMEALLAINEQNRLKIQRWREPKTKRDN